MAEQRAYVLIETVPGVTDKVIEQLRQVPGIKECSIVMGPVDIIAVIEADSMDELNHSLAKRVHTIPGIARTNTCLAIKFR